MSGPILSHRVALGDVRGELDVEIVTTLQDRARLAAEYHLLEVKALTASAKVAAEAGGGFAVSGRIVADIVQACVVTLAPVAQHIDEPFALRFVRPGSPELPQRTRPHEEVVVDPAAPDPPEVLSGSAIDVGTIAEEAFVLAIDPYPRAPGATLPPEAAAGDLSASPFAVLAALKSAKR